MTQEDDEETPVAEKTPKAPRVKKAPKPPTICPISSQTSGIQGIRKAEGSQEQKPAVSCRCLLAEEIWRRGERQRRHDLHLLQDSSVAGWL